MGDMDTVEIVIGEDGRIVSPVGVRLRIPAGSVVPEREESEDERAARIDAFVRETEEDLKDLPRRELCDSDPLVAEYRRMGFFG